MTITNTTSDPLSPMLVLLDALGGGRGSGAIEAMERRGQSELVNSDRLPTDTNGCNDQFIALGFTFGDVDPADPMFRPVTLPEGWKRIPAPDHDMWSYLLDTKGRRRVSIFYKAAYYDRSAFMRLDSQRTYLSGCVHSGDTPILDEQWLTTETAQAELRSMLAEHEERAARYREIAAKDGADRGYWAEAIVGLCKDVQRIRDLIKEIGQG